MGTSGKRESNEPVALVFQNPELLFLEDSIRREFRAMHGPAADSVAAAWLARVDLDYASLADRIPFDVSAAEGRLIAAALQLSANPGVLILDEPTIGLDPRNRSHLVRLIDSWLTDDRLLVMITHDLRLMSHYGGRTHVLDAGRLAWSDRHRICFGIASGWRPTDSFDHRLNGRRTARAMTRAVSFYVRQEH